MKQSKASKPRASRKGTEGHHEPVVEPYTVIIHDPELKRIIEERKMAEEEKMALEEKVDEPILEEPIVEILLEQPILEEPVIQMLIDEPVICPEVEQTDMSSQDEYVAVYSPCNTKVLNPSSGRYVACDGAIAKKLNLLRK